MERCPSGLRCTLGKRVYANSVPGVRIPLSPPFTKNPALCGAFLLLLRRGGNLKAQEREFDYHLFEKTLKNSVFFCFSSIALAFFN